LATGFLKVGCYQGFRKNKKRGGVVSTQDNPFPEPQGFSTGDILWAIGIWTVILGLSPVLIFYFLMVA
jgi:hypothetical protein